MSIRRRPSWRKWLILMGGGGVALQVAGCIDPDLLLQAGLQLFTEVAIFVTDNAVVGLR